MLDFFAPFFFIGLVFLVIILIVTYVKTTKLFPLLYVLFAFTYIVTLVYWIDEFDLGRNAIILLLILSSLLMIFAGKMFTQKPDKKKRFLSYVYICAAILIFFAAAGMFTIGLTVERNIVSSVSAAELYRPCDNFVNPSVVEIGNVTVSNNFIIPRKVPLDRYMLCSQSSLHEFYSLDVRDEIARTQDFEVAPFEIRVFRLSTTSQCRPIAKDVITSADDVRSSELYLIEQKDNQYGCYDVTDDQFRKAVKIIVLD